ncbi:MAG: threonine synthase [Clostridia bacterium]
MSHVSGYECTICGREYGTGDNLLTCPVCGDTGILDIRYDYSSLGRSMTRKFLEGNRDYSMWRYKAAISLDPGDSHKYLRVGWTPLYKSNRLASDLGIKELYIKDEGLNPTASLKDRASAVAAAGALGAGYGTVACSSTGNAASSLAGNAARLGLKSVIFVPERAPQGKLAQLLVFGARVMAVKGNYRQTFELSSEAINRWGWYNRNAAINPHLVEGKKTVAMEIAEQLGWKIPDWVAVSVGDGCTIAGVYKGFFDLMSIGLIERMPRLLGVQSEGCSPFVTAHSSGRPLEAADENTIADSISVGIPRNPVKAMRAVLKSGGTWISVTDGKILEAMKTLGSREGVFGEPAGAASLAGIEKAVASGIIGAGESVCMIMTGSGLKDIKNALEAAGSPVYIEPNMNELIKYFNG